MVVSEIKRGEKRVDAYLPAAGLDPVAGRIASGIRRLPPGPLGDALRHLTPIQRSVAVAEILGPPRAKRRRRDTLGPVAVKR